MPPHASAHQHHGASHGGVEGLGQERADEDELDSRGDEREDEGAEDHVHRPRAALEDSGQRPRLVFEVELGVKTQQVPATIPQGWCVLLSRLPREAAAVRSAELTVE